MSGNTCPECGGLLVSAPLSEENEFEVVCQNCGLVFEGEK